MSSNTAAILLAAGNSRRMGSSKQLLDFGGKTVLARCLETLLAGGVREIVVVVGIAGDAVVIEAGRFPVQVVVNCDPGGDMASSLRVGRDALSKAVRGIIVALCDYPLVRPETVSLLLGKHASFPDKIIIPVTGGRRGHPLLLPRLILNELRVGLTLRDLIRYDPERLHCLQVDDPGILLDMDTPEDYQRLSAAGLPDCLDFERRSRS